MAYQPKPESERRDGNLMVSLPLALRRQVEQFARQEGVSMSEVGRRAIGAYLGGSGSADREGGA